MKNTLLFLVISITAFTGIMLGAEVAMQSYENSGVMSEAYGASSESCGVMGEGFELRGYKPINKLRGPAAPIRIVETVGPAQPICNDSYCNSCNNCSGWDYQPWEPVRNTVRFFHNVRPLRKAVGWVFRRCC